MFNEQTSPKTTGQYLMMKSFFRDVFRITGFSEGYSSVTGEFPSQKVTQSFNSSRPRQNGRLFADDTFKRIFLNENIRISTENSLKFVPKGLINNIPALVLIMAWRRPGDKPLSEPMLVRSVTHICVTWPQWVNVFCCYHASILDQTAELPVIWDAMTLISL